nr:PREDICTED: zinc finger protein 277 [Megachile rotundata]XP_012146712.1 PREDICTED: zinc finger protein 277 [Megachile rotundata]XP_012146713.1 PREDICTED: zinc finger protein 277 [Megachile rotundata]XP_012146714.1 PREDICTED: zinc finger protein 277 [Megachile rotundata]
MNSEESHKNSLPNVSDQNTAVYKSQFIGLDDKPYATKCLLCSLKFVLPQNEEDLLIHLFKEHRLVIGDVWKIASLKSYIHYWGIKFEKEPLTTYCTTVLMKCTPDGKPSENETYYLLSDCISEDKAVRDEIHRARLEWVLSVQTNERTDTNFKRGCIFCRMEFSGLRITYVKHLAQKHNLYLGKPDNLVFIDELLDKIQTTIENLICIYCEKLFKDRTVLKEHMRKKLHKRINPNNKEYDKFYINNYLEPGKSWRHKQTHFKERRAEDQSSENEDEDTWSDWDDDEGVNISCLFCNYNDKNFHDIFTHMKTNHDFDFKDATKGLTFYHKVKVINYVRRQIYLQHCIFCEVRINNVLEHMKEHNHFKIPAQKIWDQPEFYFPMCENDSFLYNLDTNGSSDEDSDVENVTKSVCEMST